MWQKRVKKTIFTLNVNGYSPEMTTLTYPLIQAYARKIGADFHVITERKFPEWPVTYEKLQIYELAQQMENDWNIYIDSDCLVHPDTPDLTLLLPRDTVAHYGSDFAPTRWKTDRFFHRDGRHISSGNWLAVASDLCIELWKPVDDMTPTEAIANIQPDVRERTCGVIQPSHLIDDYVLSRNIAKYGLKYANMQDILAKHYAQIGFFYHHYLFPIEQKIEEMHRVIDNWNVAGLMKGMYRANQPRDSLVEAIAIDGWMAPAELKWLHDKAQQMESIVEIGCWKGRSTHALLSGCKGPVHAIDPFPAEPFPSNQGSTFVEFMQNVGHFPNLNVHRMTSEMAASNGLPSRIDMVFIDGDHSYEGVMADLKLWAPRAQRLLCGHDYTDPMFPGVAKALAEYFPSGTVHTGPTSLWWVEINEKG